MATSTERVIALITGDSGTGKSFAVANLRNALIFDTDIGGGLAYLDARIKKNGSERIEVGSYLQLMDEIQRRRSRLKNFTTLAIDHLTTLQQESSIRHNPTAEDDYGRSSGKATREWRTLRELVRVGDFHLICTAHCKDKYVGKKVVGQTTDASKNVEADFTMVLHLEKGNRYPSTANVVKWRRDPEDPRGVVPASFPFTLENFLKIHGYSLEGERNELQPTPPSTKPANGKPPEQPLPKDGAEFMERAKKFHDSHVAKEKSKAGELWDWLEYRGQQLGFPVDPLTWDHTQVVAGIGMVNDFQAGKRAPAKQPTSTEEPAPA